MTDKKATGHFLVRMDPKLHRELRRFAFDHGLTMREVVEGAVGEYLRVRRDAPVEVVAE
jgi:hypothetical protein